MSDKYQNKYRIPSARLQTWDYGANAAYFITICTHNRQHFFGEISNTTMQLNKTGNLAEQLWNQIPIHFPFIELGNFVVMPNHVHGILIINKNETGAIADNGINGDQVGDIDDPAYGRTDDNDDWTYYWADIIGDRTDVNGDQADHWADIIGDRSDGNGDQADHWADVNRDRSNVETRLIASLHSIDHTRDNTHDQPPNYPFNYPYEQTIDQTRDIAPDYPNHTNVPANDQLTPPTIIESPKIPGGFAGNKNPMFHQNISRIIRWYKGRCTFEIKKIHPDFAWQTRFYDHIIRDMQSFERIQNYIANNPLNWKEDSFHGNN